MIVKLSNSNKKTGILNPVFVLVSQPQICVVNFMLIEHMTSLAPCKDYIIL